MAMKFGYVSESAKQNLFGALWSPEHQYDEVPGWQLGVLKNNT